MNLEKLGFHLPESIRFDEETLTETYGKLIAEPLERGYGTTLGNSLRRVLLSSIEGAAVTAIRLPGALHEFTTLKGVKEDVIDIILNIKKLRFKLFTSRKKIARINVVGPKIVKGEDIQPDADFELLNKDQVIATLDKDAVFEAELHIKKGKGYVPSELNKDDDFTIDTIAIDSIFSPVKKVNFVVDKARVGRATDYDKLIMEIWTDGSISPKEAVTQAAQILIGHMSLFILEKKEEKEEEEIEEKEPIGVAQTSNPEIKHVESEEPFFNSNLLKSVEELELSVRSYNCLKNANIKTIADLVQKTEQEMLRTKNFGRKSLNEIKEILASMGLRLGMRVDMDALNKSLAYKSGGYGINET